MRRSSIIHAPVDVIRMKGWWCCEDLGRLVGQRENGGACHPLGGNVSTSGSKQAVRKDDLGYFDARASIQGIIGRSGDRHALQ